MVQAYSRLKRVLGERSMTVSELRRRMHERGLSVNLKSLYRLNNENEPVERLDLRVAGVICQVCKVPLSELIAFETPATKLRRLPGAKQKRLDELMEANSDGRLTKASRAELTALVREAEEVALANAQLLARQRRRLA